VQSVVKKTSAPDATPTFALVPEAGIPVRGYKFSGGRVIATERGGTQIGRMKKLELDDAVYAALEQLAAARKLTPAGLVASLVDPGQPALAGDHLIFFFASADFTRLGDPIDRYLALLAWCARHYAVDFADFISHQESGRRYLAWHRDEINEARARNLARQIDGTQFWAVMTIDDATRRRFVDRLLEFIGCHDETVTLADRALGFGGEARLRSA
jgi:hypothetical protein